MQTNQTPFYDSSDNQTGCCPRFNAEGWDGQELHFHDKPFVRAGTLSVAHIPLNMGKVFARVLSHIEVAAAGDPTQVLTLSRDPSAFSGEHLFAVTRPVEGEEMVSLTGDYLTKVFEGPYSEMRNWYAQMRDLARVKGRMPQEVWFFYTTCPKCQKVYGKNPVVGLVELAGA